MLGILEDGGLYSCLADQLFHPHGGLILSDDPGERHFCTQRNDVARDVGRAPKSIFLASHMHDRHRGLRGNALNLAKPVTVEHQVSNDQHPGVSNQFFGEIHCNSSRRRG